MYPCYDPKTGTYHDGEDDARNDDDTDNGASDGGRVRTRLADDVAEGSGDVMVEEFAGWANEILEGVPYFTKRGR